MNFRTRYKLVSRGANVRIERRHRNYQGDEPQKAEGFGLLFNAPRRRLIAPSQGIFIGCRKMSKAASSRFPFRVGTFIIVAKEPRAAERHHAELLARIEELACSVADLRNELATERNRPAPPSDRPSASNPST